MLRVFDPVLAVALAKDPADRFARCTDFAYAFAQAAHSGRHPATSASTMPRPMVRRPPKSTAVPSALADAVKRQRHSRWRTFAAASTVIALTAVGASGYTIDNDNTAPKQGPPAASPALAQPQRAAEYAPPAAPSQPLAPSPNDAPPPASPTPVSVQAAPAPQRSTPVPQRTATGPAATETRPRPDLSRSHVRDSRCHRHRPRNRRHHWPWRVHTPSKRGKPQ